jgi:hypothetical protein
MPFKNMQNWFTISDKSAPTVASSLFSRWLCRHGLLLKIVTCNGKEFCIEIVDTLLKLIGINTVSSTNEGTSRAQLFTIAAYLKTQVFF